MTGYQKIKQERNKWVKKAAISDARLSFTIEKLWTIAKLKGPECLKAPEIALSTLEILNNETKEDK